MDTEKILRERLAIVPESVRELVTGSQLQLTLHQLERRFKLSEPQANALENEVAIVLLGLAPRQEFQNCVWRNLGVDQEEAHNIAREVHQQIFKPIKGDLDAFMEAQSHESEEERDERELDAVALGDKPEWETDPQAAPASASAQEAPPAQAQTEAPPEAPREDLTQSQLNHPTHATAEERVIREDATAETGNDSDQHERGARRYPGVGDPYREPIE